VGWVPFQWPSPSERGELFRLRGTSCRGITRGGGGRCRVSFRDLIAWMNIQNPAVLHQLQQQAPEMGPAGQ